MTTKAAAVGGDVRIDPREYLALALEAHVLLADVPLVDVSAMDLPGGGDGRTVIDLQQVAEEGPLRHPGLAVRFLFGLRRGLGRLFGWDRNEEEAGGGGGAWSYLQRLPEPLKARSVVPPGTARGAFRYLYVLSNEALSEIRNGTVHAFICAVLMPTAGGYRMYWGVYVKPVSRLTAVYMAIIEPFRRFVVYPALFREIRRAWQARYPQQRSDA